jgi:putative cell wall-binding protein
MLSKRRESRTRLRRQLWVGFIAVTLGFWLLAAAPAAADTVPPGTFSLDCASIATVPNGQWTEGTGTYSAGSGISNLQVSVHLSTVALGPESGTGEPANHFFFEFDWVTDDPTYMTLTYDYQGASHTSNACALTGLIGGVHRSSDFVSGADRYATAVAVAKAAYATTAPVVFVASGESFPDALSAGPAAALLGGPLLLTESTKLPPGVAAEITSLSPSSIYVVGGTGVISSTVYASLAALAPSISRVAGDDRYATSRAVATGIFGEASTAFIATGTGFADAVSSVSAASLVHAPIILVNGAASSLDESTANTLTELHSHAVTIVGGTGVVSAGIEATLAIEVPSVVRFGGVDRYETSAGINSHYFGPSVPTTFIADGTEFPDALAGSTLAAASRAPLMIVNPLCVPNSELRSMNTWLTSNVTIIGGTPEDRPELAEGRACLEVAYFNPWDF